MLTPYFFPALRTAYGNFQPRRALWKGRSSLSTSRCTLCRLLRPYNNRSHRRHLSCDAHPGPIPLRLGCERKLRRTKRLILGSAANQSTTCQARLPTHLRFVPLHRCVRCLFRFGRGSHCVRGKKGCKNSIGENEKMSRGIFLRPRTLLFGAQKTTI